MKVLKSNYTLLLLLTSLSFSACLEDSHEIKAKDLVGIWEDSSQENTFVEEWEMNGDGSLNGKGYVMQARDTVFIEYLKIKDFNGVLTYVAKVNPHDNDAVVHFSLKDKEGNKLSFENLDHDFPQRIVYELPSDSTMHVYLEGTENGKFRKRMLYFQKRGE